MNAEKFIKKLYDKKKYLDTYGDSVAITILIVGLYFGAIGYFYILANRQDLKKDWKDIKCNPLYLPFVGLINKPPNKTISEFTMENFNQCINKILEKSAKSALTPYTEASNQNASYLSDIVSTLNSGRELTHKIRNQTSAGLLNVNDKISTFSINAAKPLIHTKSSLEKIAGMATTSVNGLQSIIYIIKPLAGSLIGIIIALIVTSLILIVASLVTAALLAWIPFVGPFLAAAFFAAAFASFAFLILSLIFGIPVITIAKNVLANED